MSDEPRASWAAAIAEAVVAASRGAFGAAIQQLAALAPLAEADGERLREGLATLIGEFGRIIAEKEDILATIQLSMMELEEARQGLEAEVEERRRAEHALKETAGELATTLDLLRRSESLTRAVVEHAADGIVTVDERYLIRGWNAAAERIFGYTRAEALGRSFQLVLPAARVPAGRRREDLARRKDGTVLPIEVHAAEATVGDAQVLVLLVRDLTESKQTELRLKELHSRLLSASREAGMADVASSILHNLGNVLNSASVSASLVVEQLHRPSVERLERLAGLLAEHEPELPRFLAEDPRGRGVPAYLRALADAARDEQERLRTEAATLQKHLDHVKVVVSTQQAYARRGGVLETLHLSEVVEDALGMSFGEEGDIRVVREYEPLPPVSLDRHRLLQILVNLLRNARHAVRDGGRPDREVTVRVGRLDAQTLRIEVRDNGVGIPPEHLGRLFEQGFTTKAFGHGYGLHSSVLAAKELGGGLRAESEGRDRGAVFCLELPLSEPASHNSPPSSGSDIK
ncbi:MAG: PAS domain S-box protein [Deltaproteobacteria bacterium]|nr:PAS domain S-box protein [Deltaproteobacteria bacterium]